MPPENEPKPAMDLNRVVRGFIWAAGQAVALNTPPGYAAARTLFADAAALERELTRAAREPGGFASDDLEPEMTEEEWLAEYGPKSDA